MKRIFILASILVLLVLTLVFTNSPSQPVAASENLGVGTTDPWVVITNLLNGNQVSGIVSIEAEASTSSGIAMVSFEADGAPIASDSAYPYSVSWDTSSLPAGSWHQLMAFVYDYLGVGTSSPVVNVQIAPSPTPMPSPTPTPAPTPIPVPTVSITNPADGSSVKRGTTVTIAANASDSQGISKVEFYVNNNLTCTDTADSYTCSWKVPTRYKTSYTLTAKAYNILGMSSQNSISVFSR